MLFRRIKTFFRIMNSNKPLSKRSHKYYILCELQMSSVWSSLCRLQLKSCIGTSSLFSSMAHSFLLYDVPCSRGAHKTLIDSSPSLPFQRKYIAKVTTKHASYTICKKVSTWVFLNVPPTRESVFFRLQQTCSTRSESFWCHYDHFGRCLNSADLRGESN